MYSAIASALNHPDAIAPYRSLFNRRILKSLAEAGTQLDVVSPRPFAPPVGPYSEYASLPEVEDWGQYMVHHPRFWYLIPKRWFYGTSGESFSRRVPPYLDRTFEVPDVVHACHIYIDGYGMLPYVREHDVPLFVVGHGTILNTLEDHSRTVQDKIRETLDEATGVLCVSDALSEKASRLTDGSKVSTVPIGADPEQFPVDQEAAIRRELDIPPEATVVLFVGQFIERKGLGEILELLPDLDLEDTVFVFVGHGGDMEEELRQTIAESKYLNRYVYTGLYPLALRRWFAVADLLLLPSHTEGRPTVIYEAMASRTAVLASSVGGIPEQVVDGETGVLLPPKDADALEDALRALTADRERLTAMGERGHERLVEKNWTWAGHAERVQRLHREAIE